MSKLSWNVTTDLFVEIIEFIDKIEKYTKGMSYDDFSKDTRTVES
ncbi:MAG: hypothetical protein ABSC20_10665 [Candidatus Bathyarchaeia archaeon]|jgi:uncharacterized protein with HEPN domain